MQRIEILLLVMVGLALGSTLFVYAKSKRELQQHYDVSIAPIVLPEGGEAIAEGERLARVRGCFWCHGEMLQGQKYFAKGEKGLVIVAPNLTAKVREYSAAEFARVVRHGVKRDGTSVQSAMPAFAYYNMSDADIGAVIAYLQSLPVQPGFEGEFRLMPAGWYLWAAGAFPPNAADLIDHAAPRPDPAIGGDPSQHGRYLAESICAECHSDNGRLHLSIAPDLIVGAAYTREEFFRLLRTGVALGEREISYHMVDAAKYRYVALTDTEIDALHSYLSSLADLPPS